MAGKVALSSLVLIAMLALGVGGAGGRAFATTILSVQVIGGGQVTSEGGQISCGAGSTSCYFSTSATTGSVDLTANDLSGWAFNTWSGCTPGPSDNECSITLSSSDADHDVTASFAPTGTSPGTSTLTVDVTGDADDKGGKVSGGQIDCDPDDTDCTWVVLTGSTVTMVQDPDDGYSFSGWGGACSGAAASCTLTMASSQTINATFAKSATTTTLNVSVTGNGTVTGGGIACTSAGGSGCSAGQPADSTVTLSATPGSGASFTGWGGACAGTSPTCSVTMDAAKSVSAAFTGGTGSTFPLSVAVTGDGTVTGGGLSCGANGGTCTSNAPAASTVTLTATPSSGATFASWGGACTGTAMTCAVTMTGAKSVTAEFSGDAGAGTGVQLRVTVTGPGAVSGGGISCGNGAPTCSANQESGVNVTLTATPATGAVFTGWGGACSGTATTCTVEMDATKSVSATFGSRSGAPAAAAAALRSRGRPIVTRTQTGFAVTLRFRTNRRGTVRVRAMRAGRLEAALSFTAPSGPAAVGPVPLAKPGFYAFDLTQGGRALRWQACLGRCGEAAARRAGPFALTRRAPTVVDAGALWSMTLHFGSTQPAGVVLRVYRGGRLAREIRFPSRVGVQSAGPLLLSPGTYRMRLSATDAYGRVRVLTWVALLP
jgi:hypothetical protein